MSQLTRQDIAEVVEEVVDRVFDRKLDQRFSDFEKNQDRKLDQRFSDFEKRLDHRLDKKLDEKLDSKLDEKLGAFVEHIDDKFESLTEAVSLMNTTMGTLARQNDLDEFKRDVKTIKAAVRATNEDLHGLERRFDRWEDRFGGLDGDSTDWSLGAIR